MAEGLPATKEQPSALDGYERAKPGEPIFTLQGGDPLAVEMTAEYIRRRRENALKLDDERKRNAELIRCSEAERTLWAMQEYLRSGRVDEELVEDKPDEPEAIDLFDYRVRAAARASNMRCELIEMCEELKRRSYDNFALCDEIEEAAADLEHINEVLEPRRMMK